MTKVSSDELKGISSIIDIVSKYLTLKQIGSVYKGLCPFHNEDTPSLIVYPETNSYYCYGCKTGGDVFNFIMQYEKVTFNKSIDIIAKMYGYEVIEKKDKDSNLYSIFSDTTELYNKKLFDNNKYLTYLMDRDISKESISLFNIGYSDYESIYKYLIEKGYNKQDILDSGIVSKKENNFFNDRIMFPIHNKNNKIIAFGGRSCDKDKPKYMNSQESRIFKKKNELYGLNITEKFIKEKSIAIVVEGYTDVIACYQAGVKNVVGVLGTSISSKNIKQLESICERIILMLDGDPAGLTAMNLAADVLLRSDMDSYIAILPDNMDPEDVISKYGKGKLKFIIENSINVIKFHLNMIKSNINIKTDKGKTLFIDKAIKSIEKYRNPLLFDSVIMRLSIITNYSNRNILSYSSGRLKTLKVDENKNKYNSYDKTAEISLLQYIICNISNKKVIEKFVSIKDMYLFGKFSKKLKYLLKKVIKENIESIDEFITSNLTFKEKKYYISIKDNEDYKRYNFDNLLSYLMISYLYKRIDENNNNIHNYESIGNYKLISSCLEENRIYLDKIKSFKFRK